MGAGQNCQLLIMRHGKSDRDSGPGRDFDRPLAERGKRDVSKIGAWLHARKRCPDAIVSSPAVRAKQTAEMLAGELGLETDFIVWERRIYEAGLEELVDIVELYADDKKRLLLIGHNPGLDYLLCHLADTEPQTTPGGKLMTTAALAILDYGASPVSTTRASARLLQLLRPGELSG